MKVVFEDNSDWIWDIYSTNEADWPEHAIEMPPEEYADLQRVNKEWFAWQLKIRSKISDRQKDKENVG